MPAIILDTVLPAGLVLSGYFHHLLWSEQQFTSLKIGNTNAGEQDTSQFSVPTPQQLVYVFVFSPVSHYSDFSYS